MRHGDWLQSFKSLPARIHLFSSIRLYNMITIIFLIIVLQYNHFVENRKPVCCKNFGKTLKFYWLLKNSNWINSNKFEVINCNDWLQQASLKYFYWRNYELVDSVKIMLVNPKCTIIFDAKLIIGEFVVANHCNQSLQVDCN